MRTLRFIVNEQNLSKDSSCDFTNIISGTRGYLEAEFVFNESWNMFGKVAVFGALLQEYPVIIKNGKCEIPPEVLDGEKFSVYVVGSKNGKRITTNSVTISQKRSEPWTQRI